MKNYKMVEITAYPYVSQTGTLEIPFGLNSDEEYDYVSEHWNEIEFDEPDLDYSGCNFEVY